MSLVAMCIGIEDQERCAKCHRPHHMVRGLESFYFPPVNIDTGECNFFWHPEDWQDPIRAQALGQNGNVGYTEGDMK